MYIQHLFVEYRHACWCSHLLSQFHQFSSGTARKLSGQLCRLKRKAVMILKRLKVRVGSMVGLTSYHIGIRLKKRPCYMSAVFMRLFCREGSFQFIT